MNHIESIDEGLKLNTPYLEIVRKVYLTYPTMAFSGAEEMQFDILNDISLYFKIPINSVHVAGSAKIGLSLHKKSVFTPGVSDLDIAIIDPHLFQQYSELVFKQTKGFKDNSTFPIKFNKSKKSYESTYKQYSTYISKGIFRPDLMPSSIERADWNTFFGKLSRKYKFFFKSINAGIYMSQVFFEYKQCSAINNYVLNKSI